MSGSYRSLAEWGQHPIDVVIELAPITKMISRSLFFCLLLALCGFMQSSAEADTNPIVLSSNASELVDLKAELQFLVDPSRELSLGEIFLRQNEFQPIETKYIDFGLGDFRVWLRASLYNPEDQTGVWRLDTGRPFSEELEIFLKYADGSVENVLSHRVTDAFSERPLNQRTLSVDIEIPRNETVQLYLSFRSSSTTSLAINFGAPLAVSDAKNRETLIDVSLNSALLALLVLALMFVSITGWRLSLAFGAYIVSGMLYVAHADGYTAQLLWPDVSISNDALILVFMLLMSASGINFGRVLFVFRDVWPTYDRFLMAISLLGLFFALLAYPFIDVVWLMVLAYLLVPLSTLIQPITGIIAYRRNLTGASAFLCGAMLVLLAILYSVIALSFPGRCDLDQTLDVGLLALLGETFAFAGAIVIRLLGLQRERDAAMSAELVAVKEKLAMSSALRDSQKRYVEAREVSRQRREHLSAVSHDLQQPLSSLRSVVSKLALSNDDAGYQMHSALDYLETLVRDNIKPDEPNVHVTQSDGVLDVFPVSIVLNNVYEMFRAEAETRRLQLRLRAVDYEVQADAVLLMRVVSNLVKNAIHHSEAGAILLAARLREHDVSIEVYDTGAGIAEADIERLLRRGEKSETSKGQGLGLSIVKDISDANNWRLELSSKPHHGTRARIFVPRHSRRK